MSKETKALVVRREESETAHSKIGGSIDAELLRTLESQHPGLASAHSYRWFSRANFKNAQNYYRALGVANRHEHHDQTNFFAEAIVDLYQRDRAERASHSKGDDEEPKRLEQLPSRITRQGEDYALRLSHIDRYRSIPHDIVAGVSKMYLQTQDPPDMLMLGKYVQRHRPALRDPIIYARYGNWFVKLGEWT